MSKMWFIFQKDLLCELRARQVWPRVAALGLAVGFLLTAQLAGLSDGGPDIPAAVCWLTIGIAGIVTSGQSVAAEGENGCWDGLRGYPVGPASLYLAKLAMHAVTLGIVQSAVVPFVLWSCGVVPRSWAGLAVVMLLGNLGVSAVGTLVGALSAGIRRGQGLLPLLLLPLLIPILLAAARSTSLALGGPLQREWWHWVQVLAGCALLYSAAGVALFDFAVED